MRIKFNNTALSESKLGKITPIQNLNKKFMPKDNDNDDTKI